MKKSPQINDGRRLQLAEAVNFRDIGGYRTLENRTVRRGCIYRSDHLSCLTPEDQERLLQLQFKFVCDLRTLREQQMAPDLLPPDKSISYLSLPVEAENFDPAIVYNREYCRVGRF